MSVESNYDRYLTSLNDELEAQADRVRSLIGSRHWLLDGKHKEHLLAELIRRHCPKSVAVSTGFVLSPRQSQCSTEQDILLVDASREAPVFDQGGLIIAFPRSVLATVSVKTTLHKESFIDLIRGLVSVKEVAAISGVDPAGILAAGFFYTSRHEMSSEPDLLTSWLEEEFDERPPVAFLNGKQQVFSPLDVIACGGRSAYLVDVLDPAESGLRLRPFQCNGLATGIFMAQIIDSVGFRFGLPEADFFKFADRPSSAALQPHMLKIRS